MIFAIVCVSACGKDGEKDEPEYHPTVPGTTVVAPSTPTTPEPTDPSDPSDPSEPGSGADNVYPHPEYLVIANGSNGDVLTRVLMHAELDEDSGLTYYTAKFEGGLDFLRNDCLYFYFEGEGYYWSFNYGTLNTKLFQNLENAEAPIKDTKVHYPFKVVNWTGGDLTFRLLPEQDRFADNLLYIDCTHQFYSNYEHNVVTVLELIEDGEYRQVEMSNAFEDDENSFITEIELVAKKTKFRVVQYLPDSMIRFRTYNNITLKGVNTATGSNLCYKDGYGEINNNYDTPTKCSVYVFFNSGLFSLRQDN